MQPKNREHLTKNKKSDYDTNIMYMNYNNVYLYNNPSYSRILIGSRL